MFMVFVLLILLDSRGFSISQYEISPVLMANTEKYIAYTEPLNERVWLSYIEDAQNLGLLFAGKAEFSWVVDLRIHNTNQEFWSTGNLFSAEWVMTTCRAKHYLDKAWKELLLNNIRSSLNPDPEGVLVTFFQLYYWEYVESSNWEKFHGNSNYGGTRRIDAYVTHPRCSMNELKYDIAMLKLKDKINPANPFIGYMPTIKDPRDDRKFADVDFTRMESQSKLCYVGSIGRNYVNWRFHLVLDFKVRFRVYYEPIAHCTDLVHRLCDSKAGHDCTKAFSEPNAQGREWVCMRTRSKVGTVCDHDRGAPVVCDDEVVGMVAYGAIYKNCNNRIAMPFVVLKLHTFSEWTHALNLQPVKER